MKPKKEKNAVLIMRISPHLKLKWKALADKKNQTLTDFVKSTIEVNHQFFDFSDIEKELNEMFKERVKQGKNLNQITKRVHQGNLTKEEIRSFQLYLLEFNNYYSQELNLINDFFIEIYKRLEK